MIEVRTLQKQYSFLYTLYKDLLLAVLWEFHASILIKIGLIQKLGNAKLNILQPSDTQTYVCVSDGYSILMFKSFRLHNF